MKLGYCCSQSQLLIAYKQQTYPKRFAGNRLASTLILNYSKIFCIQLTQGRASKNMVAKEQSTLQDHNPSAALMTYFKKPRDKNGGKPTDPLLHFKFLEKEGKGRIGSPCMIF